MVRPRLEILNNRVCKRELQLGLSVALFYLWLPLMAPHILISWKQQPSLWDLRGLMTVLVAIGGFSATLLLDRFMVRATQGLWRLWVGSFLMLSAPLVLFIRLPRLAGLFVLFLSAACVAIQILPVIKALRDSQTSFNVIFFGAAAGCGLSVVGRLILNQFGQTSPLPAVALACMLLTGGMFATRYFRRLPTNQAEEVHDLYVPINRTKIARIHTARRAGLILCCACVLCLAAGFGARWSVTHSEISWLAPVFLFFATGVLTVIKLTCQRLVFLNVAASGVFIGGLILSSGLAGVAVYANLFFLLLGMAGVGMLLFENLYQTTSSVNRVFAMGLGCTAIFLTWWMSADMEQLRWIGERIQYPEISLIATSVLFFLFLPLVLGHFHAEKAEKAPHAVESAEGAQDSEAYTEQDKTETRQSALEELFTGAEKKVYKLILLGYSNQQMADMLVISINTIKFHIKNILAKAGATNKSQLRNWYLPEAPDHENREIAQIMS